MTRYEFPIPAGGPNGDQLAAALGEPSLHVQVVDDLLVVHTDNPDVESIVAAHVPVAVQHPLPPYGVLATLLAVVGAVPLEDAANAVHLEPEALVNEALAWAACT